VGAETARSGGGVRTRRVRLDSVQLPGPLRLCAALHPDGDEEGDHVVHPRRIGARASNCSPIAVFTRPGRARSLLRPDPVESHHQPVRRRP